MRKRKTNQGNLSMRRCEIVSNLESEDGEKLFDIERMKQVLEEKSKTCIKEFSYIIHDKDVYTEEDERKNEKYKCGELKPKHIHLLLRFFENQPQKLKNIAGWFQIPPNFVSKIHNRWDSAVLYQIHANCPEKYQYDISEVTANFKIENVINNFMKRNSIDSILMDILNGEIPEYQRSVIPPLFRVHYAREINEAFRCRVQNLQETVKSRKMECIYITGSSQAGKTTLAKKIAEEKGLPYYISSSGTDFLGEYALEPCVILDDIRPSSITLSELFKLLDNNTVSAVKSRYKNKCLANCKLLIITTVLDIETFYHNVFSEEDEPMIQFKRRCGTHLRMNKERIYISRWDSLKKEYTEETEYLNDILDRYMPKEDQTEQDVINYVSETMPFLKQADESEKMHGFEIIDDLESPFK